MKTLFRFFGSFVYSDCPSRNKQRKPAVVSVVRPADDSVIVGAIDL